MCHLYILFSFFFFLMILLPPTSTLFPYTTLFRSALQYFVKLSTQKWYENPSVPRWQCSWNRPPLSWNIANRSEEHTSELQSLRHLVCRLLLEKKKKKKTKNIIKKMK